MYGLVNWANALLLLTAGAPATGLDAPRPASPLFSIAPLLSLPQNLGRRDLERLGLTPGEKGTVIVDESDDPENPFPNVRVIVREMPTGSLIFGLGVNSDCGLVGSVVLNERNFSLTSRILEEINVPAPSSSQVRFLLWDLPLPGCSQP